MTLCVAVSHQQMIAPDTGECEALRARLAAAESERDSALVNLQWRNELMSQMRQQQQTLLEHVHVLKHKYDIAKVSTSMRGGAAGRTCSPATAACCLCSRRRRIKRFCGRSCRVMQWNFSRCRKLGAAVVLLLRPIHESTRLSSMPWLARGSLARRAAAARGFSCARRTLRCFWSLWYRFD